MKLSDYTYVVDTQRGIIWFNTLNNIFSYLKKDMYNECAPQGDFDVNILEAKYPQIYSEFVEKKFIIPDEVDEFALLQNEYKGDASKSSDVFDITLLPSLDCNLRCWYCYEKHIKGSHISEGVAESIYKYVQSIAAGKDMPSHIHVEMFGGEPLLYFKEELYPLLKRLKDVVEEHSKTTSFFFVTNAVCITEDTIPLFKDLNANFQISIDGYREKHDTVKFIPKTKEGTYNHVMKVVHLLTKELDNTYINLRINYDDQTLSHLPELIQDIDDVDRRKIGVHLERVWQTSGCLNRHNKQLIDIVNQFLRHRFEVSYMNLSRRSHSCKSSKENQCIISYDGKVYKCTGRDFTDDFSEGRLQEDGNILWNEEKLQKRMKICTYDNALCRACKMLPLCWGPCNQKLLESGTSEDVISRYCQLNLMEMPLDDYIRYRINNEVIISRNHE